jgi:CO dehydrogenase/acetyl-CoA synthase gamma subunit (corrinoid Fe-S protein)
MTLTGMQIFKLLPKTNCTICGFPTCLAFAINIAASQTKLSDCPFLSEETRAKINGTLPITADEIIDLSDVLRPVGEKQIEDDSWGNPS